MTPAEVAAAEARIATRDRLVEELNRLVDAQTRAVQDATIDLTVAVDFECAAGLRRKTRTTGSVLSPCPPREALKRVDAALATFYLVRDKHQEGIDALIERIDSTNEQFAADLAAVRASLIEPSPAGRRDTSAKSARSTGPRTRNWTK